MRPSTRCSRSFYKLFLPGSIVIKRNNETLANRPSVTKENRFKSSIQYVHVYLYIWSAKRTTPLKADAQQKFKSDTVMNEQTNTEWKRNVVLVDATYLDEIVFRFSVQLERMLERAMPKLDLPRWLDYVSLDGGLRPAQNQIQALLVYDKPKAQLVNIAPSDLRKELDGKAFKDNLGEFSLATFPVEDEVVTRGALMVQSVEMLLTSEKVQRLMVVADMANYGSLLRGVLRNTHGKDVTLFTLEPADGFHCNQERLTYSLMAALGVRGEELPQ